MLAAFFFPGEPMPVTASAWLALHLAFGVACYGLFGIAAVHAWFMRRAEVRIRHAEDPRSGLPLLALERLTYRFVAAGFVLLSATLFTASLFSDSLYGWRWDHKPFFHPWPGLRLPRFWSDARAFGWRRRASACCMPDRFFFCWAMLALAL